MAEAQVIVIGAGIVGAAAAFGLAQRGMKPLVLDGADLDYRAARGNGGLVWVQGKGMDMVPYQHLTRRSSDMWPEMARHLCEVSGTDIQYQRRGGVEFCMGDAQLADRERELSRLHGQPGAAEPDFEMLDRAALDRLMPGMRFGRDVAGASFCWRDGHLDPLRMLLALQIATKTLGGILISNQPVRSISHKQGVFEVATESGVYVAPRILIAAGNGSAPLARQVGLEVPVRPQRGQMFVTERLAPIMPFPADGLRQTGEGTFQVGATEEEVGFDLGTTVAAAATLSRKAIRILPSLGQARLVRHWSSLRVMTPDGCPIYAQSERCPGAFVAVCHSGITLAALHVHALAEALATGALPAELSSFHNGRFDVQAAA